MDLSKLLSNNHHLLSCQWFPTLKNGFKIATLFKWHGIIRIYIMRTLQGFQIMDCL